MDGSSWAPHRFVTDGTADRPPFYLEPDHPAAYPDHFEDAGFTPVVRYLSSRTDAPGEAVGDVPPALPHEDLAFRTLADDQFERGLRRIYDVVTASAAHRPFYTPRSYADFAAQYQALRPAIVPELVLFAERPSDGKLVGLCFLIPDYRQRAQDTVVDPVILQTLAVHPEAAPEGLGEWLVATAHFRAHAAGFRSVIHALLPADSSYRRLSAQYASPFRRYALFGRAL
jgi:GNAT superfamily N-acetyltransferase